MCSYTPRQPRHQQPRHQQRRDRSRTGNRQLKLPRRCRIVTLVPCGARLQSAHRSAPARETSVSDVNVARPSIKPARTGRRATGDDPQPARCFCTVTFVPWCAAFESRLAVPLQQRRRGSQSHAHLASSSIESARAGDQLPGRRRWCLRAAPTRVGVRPVRTFIKFGLVPRWCGHRAPRLAALARASDRPFLVQCPVKGDYHDFSIFQ